MKKNIAPINVKGQAHGYWEMYYGGRLWYKGNYINGKKDGYWEDYDMLSMGLYAKRYYII